MKPDQTEALWVRLPEAAAILGVSLNHIRNVMAKGNHGFTPWPMPGQKRILRSELTERGKKD